MSELARRYGEWVESSPGKMASAAATSLVRTASACGYMLPEHVKPANAPFIEVLVWVRRRLGRPDYEVIP